MFGISSAFFRGVVNYVAILFVCVVCGSSLLAAVKPKAEKPKPKLKAVSAKSVKPKFSWQFQQKMVQGKTVRPRVGTVKAALKVPAKFLGEQPGGLEIGNGQTLLFDPIPVAQLPIKGFTVSMWMRLDDANSRLLLLGALSESFKKKSSKKPVRKSVQKPNALKKPNIPVGQKKKTDKTKTEPGKKKTKQQIKQEKMKAEALKAAERMAASPFHWALVADGGALKCGFPGQKSPTTSKTYCQAKLWYHVVAVVTAKKISIYVDGVECGSSKPFFPNGVKTIRLVSAVPIGVIWPPKKKKGAAASKKVGVEKSRRRGHIATMALYDQSLSRNEVRQLFDAEKSRFPGAERALQKVVDWPTYMRDSRRSGLSAASLKLPLQLRWSYQLRNAPIAAWPDPAKFDFWKKRTHKPRVVFDRTTHVVAVGNRVFFGNSADDKVVCLNRLTGKKVWEFFTEGPVRLAPTISQGRVVVGSDDGMLYCLRADNGKLIWKHSPVEKQLRLPGNGRVMSLWPIRTGAIVDDDGNIFYGAGIFPKQGVYLEKVDLKTGKEAVRKTSAASAQGYLSQIDGRLHLATGRNTRGQFSSFLLRSGKLKGPDVEKISNDFPYTWVGAGDLRFGGGDGKIGAFDKNSGKKLWEAKVDGRAYSLAICRGDLLVSTDRGKIYAFSFYPNNVRRAAPVEHRETVVKTWETDAAYQKHSQTAKAILKKAGLNRGFCLVVGCGDGRLMHAIARQSDMQVIGIDSSADNVAAARRGLDVAGIYGRRAAVFHGSLEQLRFTDYLFNVVVIAKNDAVKVLNRQEVSRVLRPGNGVAIDLLSLKTIVQRPPLKGTGEWTHTYGNTENTLSSREEHTSNSMAVQWFGEPGPRKMVDRHHRSNAPLFKDGRLFVPTTTGAIAVDGYNGTILWERKVPGFLRVGVMKDSGNMCLGESHLFLAGKDKCHQFRTNDGAVQHVYQTAAVDPKKTEWGYLAVHGKRLVGSSQIIGASFHVQSPRGKDHPNNILEKDFREVILSRNLFGYDIATHKLAWKYGGGVKGAVVKNGTGAKGAGGVAILNSTIGISDGVIYFLESADPKMVNDVNGRVRIDHFCQSGAKLVALELKTGNVVWKRAVKLPFEHIIYLSVVGKRIIFSGSYNAKGHVQYELFSLSCVTGKQEWQAVGAANWKTSGTHGEQWQHPTIISDTIYVGSFAFDVATGKKKPFRFQRGGHGCGAFTGSMNHLYARGGVIRMYDLDLPTTSGEPLASAMRTGCWVSVIPAGGLVLVPESSAGCSCPYPVQTTIVFRPLEKPVKKEKQTPKTVKPKTVKPKLLKPKSGAPTFSWQFQKKNVQGKTVDPQVGTRKAVLAVPPKFLAEHGEPRALKIGAGQSVLFDPISTKELAAKELAAKTFSVAMWVRVEDPKLSFSMLSAYPHAAAQKLVPQKPVPKKTSGQKPVLNIVKRTAFWSFGVDKERFYWGFPHYKKWMSSREFCQGKLWYHLVGVVSPGKISFYVDGVLNGSIRFTLPNNAAKTMSHFQLAVADRVKTQRLATGHLGGVSWYGQSLSESDVRRLFDAEKGRYPGAARVVERVVDWPSYMRDQRRSGLSLDRLKLPLQLRWSYELRNRPIAAWPEPAKLDYWTRKSHKPRVVFDRATHLVAVGNHVYFGNSADDKVVCLDRISGKKVWEFFTDGPVRLAPTIANGRVVVGSDDGTLYCLRADNGALIWKRTPVKKPLQLPGNGRVISLWPVRTGAMIDEKNNIFYGAGIFPQYGVYLEKVDLKTGKEAVQKPIQESAQGYLSRINGRLHLSTGRKLQGALTAVLLRRGKLQGPEANKITKDFPYMWIGAGDLRFGGGDGKIGAFHANTGKKLWEAKVDGRAYSLAVCRGHLLVSTDRGKIYAFAYIPKGAKVASAIPHREKVDRRWENDAAYKTYSQTAISILKTAGMKRGYCLVLGSGNGRLVHAIAKQSDMQVIGIDSLVQNVASARRGLDASGIYGRRASVRHGSTERFPFTDYLFNLVVVNRTADGKPVPVDRAELRRILCPGRGVVVDAVSLKKQMSRPPLRGVGEWTHAYGNPQNTLSSEDTHTSKSMTIQWFGKPGPRKMVDRHHCSTAPLFKDGRLFVPTATGTIAVDGYNGTILWERNVPGFLRVGMMKDSGSMCAGGKSVFLTGKENCYQFFAKDGSQQHLYKTVTIDPKKTEWGYLATYKNRLLGSSQAVGASFHEQRKRGNLHPYDTIERDFRPVILSRNLFAYDTTTHKLAWRYDGGKENPGGVGIINSAVGIAEGRVYFLESAAKKVVDDADGRIRIDHFCQSGIKLVSLDVKTGQVIWKKALKLPFHHIIYLSISGEHVIFSGTRNIGNRVTYELLSFSTKDGKKEWQAGGTPGWGRDGTHGEQWQHPAIIGDTIYLATFAFEVKTGKKKSFRFQRGGHGCGAFCGSATHLYARGGNIRTYDLSLPKTSGKTLSTITRTGCWVSIIPAGGLILIPESSSGCGCPYPVQSTIVFRPLKKPALGKPIKGKN